MPSRVCLLPLAMIAAATLAGCAAPQVTSVGLQPAAGPSGQVRPAPAQAGTGYTLGAKELAMDCRKLTGRIQIRLLHMRDAEKRSKASAVGRGLNAAAAPLFGATRYGIDPVADAQGDRALIAAYNRRLAEKGCKTVNIDAESGG